MNFLERMGLVVEWLFLFVLSLIVDLLGLIMVPIALRACDEQSEHLPSWAWAWDNDRDGINGDAGWALPEHANGRQREYWWRFWWLAIRNPGNNFGYKLGRTPEQIVTLSTNTHAQIGDQAGHAGQICVWCSDCWCFYSIVPYSDYDLIARQVVRRCVRIALGWKIWDLAQTRAQIVGVINPFASFSAAV